MTTVCFQFPREVSWPVVRVMVRNHPTVQGKVHRKPSIPEK